MNINKTTCSIFQSFLFILEFVEFLSSSQGITAFLGILIYSYLIAGLR
jgi:hypothetical protein